MREACAACDAWHRELLTDVFVDGLCRLAQACHAADVSDAGLAAAATDASAGLSAVARAILAFRKIGAPAAAVPGRGTPIDVDDFAVAVGLEPARLQAALEPTADRSAPEPESQVPQTIASSREAWRWPAREVERPIVAPAMAFSASRLNTFAKCPRRWYYEYLCDAVEDPGSVHTAYGKVFHDALEALHREIRVPSQIAEEEILARLKHELDAAFGRSRAQFASELEYAVCRAKARSVAEHYVRWLKRETAHRPVEVRDIELLQRWTTGGHTFVGYIDRIDRPLAGGPITIYDYKTGRIPDDPSEYLESVRNGAEGQLALYWAMRRAQHDDVGRIALISIRGPRDPVWLLALDIVGAQPEAALQSGAAGDPASDGIVRVACTTADLEKSIAGLVARCEALTRGGIEHFGAGDDPPCSYCAYGRACRERPIERERIFAR